MATKHKAATEVTLAPTEEATPFHRFVERHWKTAAVVTVGITAGILLRVHFAQRQEAAADASWDRLRQDVSFGSGFFSFIQTPDASVLANLAESLEGEQAAPWAKALQVQKLLEEGAYDEARAALGELEATWPDHALVTRPLPGGGDELRTLPELWRARLGAIQAWETSHPELFANPTLPEGSPRVRLTTSRGDVLVGLYEGRAPRHVENFLKLCEEGFYDGTAFHRVIRGFMIQGGDPNTREDDTDTWGQGGPGYTIEPELGELLHYPLAFAAAKKPGETGSSGSQFYIVTGEAHHLDGQHTVFGTVLEGEAVVEEIEGGAVVGDRPQDPVEILSTEILP